MNYIVQTVLSRTYKMVTVADVFQGMHQLRMNEAVELIIIDADFNTAECWEFVRHIKSSWIYNRPVVMLASDKTLSPGEKESNVRVDYFFQKPFSPVDLIKTIDALLYNVPSYSA